MGALKEKLGAVGLLWLRVLMGTGIAMHGYGKIFTGNMSKFAEGVSKLGFPAPLLFAWLAALSEFAGGILVAIGLGTRIAAFSVFISMSVAAFQFHANDPLKVKELALAYWTMAGALVFLGAGPISCDGLIKALRRKK